jgi:hypothetical protein
VQFGAGNLLFERAQNRRGKYNIADGTETYDKDLFQK